ncbi:MAG: hypothetical protein ACK4F9_00265 [Brevinematia bacterium]
MKRVVIGVYTIFALVVSAVIGYLVIEYIYLKISFENIFKEIREYQDVPYISRKLSLLETEYKRIVDFEKENKTPGLVLSKVVAVFNKNGVKIDYIVKESQEDFGEIYKASVNGGFREVFLSLGEIESMFLPIRIIKIYMSGGSDNVNMVFYFDMME